jgi:glycosyltransferase involved in cell wall biosynthesis
MESSSADTPLVGIMMVTYNHEKYIEQAIESVMMQATSFAYRLFVAEDRSPDNTRAICKRLYEKYPDKIDLHCNEKNKGSSQNVTDVLTRILHSGVKYVCILDGDDYWTDKNKLQKQVDILERDSAASFCFTAVKKLDENTGEFTPVSFGDIVNNRLGLDQFLTKGAFVPTLTMCFKVDRFPRVIPDFFSKSIKQDWLIELFVLQNGDGVLLDEVTGVYRMHGGGVLHSKRVNLLANNVYLLSSAHEYLRPAYDDFLQNVITWAISDLAFAHLENGDFLIFLKKLNEARKMGERKKLKWYWLHFKKFGRITLNKLKG